MQAKDVMTPNVVTVGPDTKVAEIAKILLERRISGVPVVADGRVVGIVSEGDLLRRCEIGTDRHGGPWWLRLFSGEGTPEDFVRSHGTHARDIMTEEVISVTEDTPLSEIADIFETRHVKRVPVLRDGALVGIVCRANLVQALAGARSEAAAPSPRSDREIRTALLDTLEAQPWWRPYSATVTVDDGVVHFWGVTGREDDRRAARVAAENIAGVRKIEDHRTPAGEILGGE